MITIDKKSINLRRNIKEIIKKYDDNKFDLSEVDFISRAVADEICNMNQSGRVKFVNAQGDVKVMLDNVCESLEPEN